MNFSIRTLMLNVTYVAIAIAAWCSASELFLALVTFFFVILILCSAACCVIATENRTYWLGSAIVSCGLLLTSPYLLIFDAIANYEFNRRHAVYAYAAPTLLPPATYVQSGSLPPIPPPATSSGITWLPPSYPVAPTPYATSLSFGLSGGFSAVMKAFLVTAVAYLAGAIAGVICAKAFVEDKKTELLEGTN